MLAVLLSDSLDIKAQIELLGDANLSVAEHVRKRRDVPARFHPLTPEEVTESMRIEPALDSGPFGNPSQHLVEPTSRQGVSVSIAKDLSMVALRANGNPCGTSG